MSSAQSIAAGKATASVKLDAADEKTLARFVAAGGEHLFEWPSKEELSGKKGKKDQARRRTNRDARNQGALATLEAGVPDSQCETPDRCTRRAAHSSGSDDGAAGRTGGVVAPWLHSAHGLRR